MWRGGKEEKIKVRIAELKDSGSVRSGSLDSLEDHGRLGLVVQPLTREEKENAGIDAGVRVVSVDGPAAQAGVQLGDIVLAINSHRVRNAEDLRSEVAKIRDGGVAALLTLRDDAQIFIPVHIGEPAK